MKLTDFHSIDSWTICWAKLGNGAVEAAHMLMQQNKGVGKDQEESDLPHSRGEKMEHYRKVTKKEEEEGIEEMSEQSKENLELYHKLVEKLCDQVEVAELQWRHYNTALTMLCGMLRHDVDFPLRAAAIFTENLIHENLLVRKASLHVVDCLMKKTKRPHPKIRVSVCSNGNPKVDNGNHDVALNGDHRVGVCGDVNGGKLHTNGNGLCSQNGDHLPLDKIENEKSKTKGLLVKPGEREDNEFLQYGGDRKPTSEQDWEAPRFLIITSSITLKTVT